MDDTQKPRLVASNDLEGEKTAETLFSEDLKERLKLTVSPAQIQQIENAITNHLILKAKRFGSDIGNAIANAIFNFIGGTHGGK